jgi:hypothetical protein
MKLIIKDFILDMIRQVFGWSKPRVGDIIVTPYTMQKMREYGLDIATLEDVFRHGVGKKHKIVQKYSNVIVGIYFKAVKSKPFQSQTRYVITACWRRKRYFKSMFI